MCGILGSVLVVPRQCRLHLHYNYWKEKVNHKERNVIL